MVAFTHFRRLSAAALILGCAASANAWITVAYGTYVTPVNFTFFTPISTFSTLVNPPTTTFSFVYTPTTIDGIWSVTNGVQTLNVDFASTSVAINGGTYSYSGDWTETSNAGLPLVVPEGTFSGSMDAYNAGTQRFTSGFWSMTFVGTLVPEPTPYAALGIGLVGLLVRRRKNR